ncbi:MAG: hypothetical protein OHK93_001644 [Ramalina farinacea]|uniref:Aminoglycoside phosphotransferase domain-containing protein n=1 Tax=Ramalina farinacea TaxID=258253 RepID=A0AA43TT23_9LECA|nr:hypothetical protein [Ramalina farinacea]
MSQRYVRFNVHELARVAAEAVGSKACEKYPDGMYNKAFLMTMDDGTEIVAKIPNPNAGRSHFATASEVATMEFSLHGGSRADENPVGAEYIVMEKIQGIQLDAVRAEMGIEDRFKIVKAIARLQKTWMTFSFREYGSLYYTEDLHEYFPRPLYTNREGVKVMTSRFAIGPSTGRGFSDDGRSTVEFDRGPWIYQPTRNKKLKALECYRALVKYLLPTGPSTVSPFLWHGDLHIENIFVASKNHTQIIGIIDWQSTELAPLFEHARLPCFLDYDGPPTVGLERPRLPDNLAQLDFATQMQAKALYLRQSLSALYKPYVHKQNRRLYSALAFGDTPIHDILILGRSMLVDGEAAYLAWVAKLERSLADLPGIRARETVPFPSKFTNEERAQIESEYMGSVRDMEAMRKVKESLGELFPERGIVRSDQYEASRKALQRIRERVIGTYAKSKIDKVKWLESWPFNN